MQPLDETRIEIIDRFEKQGVAQVPGYNMFKYTVAYISLFIILLVGIFIFMNIFGYIDLSFLERKYMLILIVLPLSLIYHKYKPMTFKELIIKYVGINLPTWKKLRNKFMIILGVDKDILNKENSEEKK